MSHPGTAREALIAEALGDVARLLDRVDALQASLQSNQAALVQAHAQLAQQLGVFEAGIAAVAESTKAQAVQHIARHTHELARESLARQTQAMTAAARAVFNAELGEPLQRLTSALRLLVSQVQAAQRARRRWLLPAATVAATSAATAAITWAVLT
jgi:NADPH:quinone reductase-like Zn-dependent oxidoreductase